MNHGPVVLPPEPAEPSVTVVHGDKEITGHPDLVHKFVEDLKKQQLQQQRKIERWGTDPERMARLCAAFPTLSDWPGTIPWNASRFLAALFDGTGGSGARHAARFCLQVWNQSTDWPKYLADVAKQTAPATVTEYLPGDAPTRAAARAEAMRQGYAVREERVGRALELVMERPDPDESVLWKRLQRYLADLRKDLQAENNHLTEASLRTMVWERAQEGFATAGPFNVAHAIAVWDAAHVAAFLSWVEVPFWP